MEIESETIADSKASGELRQLERLRIEDAIPLQHIAASTQHLQVPLLMLAAVVESPIVARETVMPVSCGRDTVEGQVLVCAAVGAHRPQHRE